MCTVVVGANCRAYAGLSENEDTWKKLETLNRARELYTAGESAYKAGNLENASVYWLQALQSKPDSTYTKQCLAKAQKVLSDRYDKSASQQLRKKDKVSAYLSLKSLCTYIPNSAALSARVDGIKGQMTSNELKAVDACNKAADYYYKRNYSDAKESILLARTLASTSETVEEAAKSIQKAYADEQKLVAKKAALAAAAAKADPQQEPETQQVAAGQAAHQTRPSGTTSSGGYSPPAPGFQPLFAARRAPQQYTRQAAAPFGRSRPQFARSAPQPVRTISQPTRSSSSCFT